MITIDLIKFILTSSLFTALCTFPSMFFRRLLKLVDKADNIKDWSIDFLDIYQNNSSDIAYKEIYKIIERTKLPFHISDKMCRLFELSYNNITRLEIDYLLQICLYSFKSADMIYSGYIEGKRDIWLITPTFIDKIVESILKNLIFIIICFLVCIFFGLIIFILFKYLI